MSFSTASPRARSQYSDGTGAHPWLQPASTSTHKALECPAGAADPHACSAMKATNRPTQAPSLPLAPGLGNAELKAKLPRIGSQQTSRHGMLSAAPPSTVLVRCKTEDQPDSTRRRHRAELLGRPGRGVAVVASARPRKRVTAQLTVVRVGPIEQVVHAQCHLPSRCRPVAPFQAEDKKPGHRSVHVTVVF